MPSKELQMARLITSPNYQDNRGSFNRLVDVLWDIPEVVQVSRTISLNPNTLRGMHSCLRECNEFKIISCLSGSIQDVLIDLRPESTDYKKVLYFELSGSDTASLVIPPGYAHGYITREPNTSVLYAMTALYQPEKEVEYRWDDPILGIEWDLEAITISERDTNIAFLSEFPEL